MQPVSARDYQELTNRLAVSGLTPSAAEAHGMLCALICAHQPQAEESWVAELMAGTDDADLLTQECRVLLRGVAERTRGEIKGPAGGFTPLLPADELPLRARALGLYDWSRGFLYGLGLAGVDEKDLSAEGREAFADIANITRLDLDGLDDSEENEAALMELTEYVRVAAMLVYEERGRRQGPPA